MARQRKKKKEEKTKSMKIADLRQVSPGVLVNENYKPGADPALDAVLQKLKKDPSSLNKSGFGKRWKI